MKSFEEFTVTEIVDQIEDGILLGIPADYSGVPMTFTKELINKGIKNYFNTLTPKKTGI